MQASGAAAAGATASRKRQREDEAPADGASAEVATAALCPPTPLICSQAVVARSVIHVPRQSRRSAAASASTASAAAAVPSSAASARALQPRQRQQQVTQDEEKQESESDDDDSTSDEEEKEWLEASKEVDQEAEDIKAKLGAQLLVLNHREKQRQSNLNKRRATVAQMNPLNHSQAIAQICVPPFERTDEGRRTIEAMLTQAVLSELSATAAAAARGHI